jgi:hypothetical protein
MRYGLVRNLHFHISNCLVVYAFVHVHQKKRRKLDKKEVKCIFIGYKEGMKGYKLWDPASRRTMYNEMWSLKVGMEYEYEVVQTKNNPQKMRFELRNEDKDDSDE